MDTTEHAHTQCLFASQSLAVFLGSKICIFFLDKLFHVPNIFPISELTGHMSLTSLPYPFIITVIKVLVCFYLFIYGCVGSLLLCMSFQAFSSCGEPGLLIVVASVVPEQGL